MKEEDQQTGFNAEQDNIHRVIMVIYHIIISTWNRSAPLK